MEMMHWKQLRSAFEAAVDVPQEARGAFVAAMTLEPVVREELLAMLDADTRNHRAVVAGNAGARLQRLLRAIADVTGPPNEMASVTPLRRSS